MTIKRILAIAACVLAILALCNVLAPVPCIAVAILLVAVAEMV